MTYSKFHFIKAALSVDILNFMGDEEQEDEKEKIYQM